MDVSGFRYRCHLFRYGCLFKIVVDVIDHVLDQQR